MLRISRILPFLAYGAAMAFEAFSRLGRCMDAYGRYLSKPLCIMENARKEATNEVFQTFSRAWPILMQKRRSDKVDWAKAKR